MRLVLAIVAVFFASLDVFAVGTVTRTFSQGDIHKYTLEWTSTAGGAVSANAFQVTGYVFQLRVLPNTGATQPSDNYDITLVDRDSIDILDAGGADLSNATGTYIVLNPPILIRRNTLDLVVANAGSAKTGTVEIWVKP